MRGKRAASESTHDLLIAIIIGVLILCTILIFYFREDIMTKIKSLPSYKPNPDTLIDISQLSDSELDSLCPKRIGKIVSESYNWFYDYGKISFCGDEKCSSGKMKASKIIIEGRVFGTDSGFYDSVVSVDYRRNYQIGQIKNRQFSIDSTKLINSGLTNQETIEAYSLNGAFVILSENLICKKITESPEK